MIADPATVPLVRDALRDGEWWVRLRAGLALTRFGAAGRNVLLAAEGGAYEPSRDMARLVLRLPPQAPAEYAAGAPAFTAATSRSSSTCLGCIPSPRALPCVRS